MNKHILCVMDRKNKTRDELRAAAAAAYAAYAAAAAAADAAYATYTHAADIEYWLDIYFERSGEDREDYEKAIEEGVG